MSLFCAFKARCSSALLRRASKHFSNAFCCAGLRSFFVRLTACFSTGGGPGLSCISSS